jgi:eukaryotic-like serine/threonine-protein kinase
VLARVSLAGGATREVLEGVVDADWAPDAKSLGVIRETPDQSVALEFPIGKTLYKSPTLQYMRISPRGDSIAIADFASGRETVRNVDLQGKASVLVSSPGLGGGIAWTPDGREIWFSQISRNGPPNVWAVDLRGRTRPVLQSPSWLVVHDIAADGKVLLTQNGWRAGVAWTLPGQAREQEVSWLDWSTPADLSGDGKTLLFSENREGGGERGSVFLRRDPSQPAVRLGDGAAFALSPDGNWALTYLNGPPDKQRLVLLPTGAGDEKTIPTGALEELSGGAWLPDGRRILVNAREGGKGRSLFLIELPAGAPRAISPETVQGRPAVSPDGSIVANRAGPAIRLYPVQGGSPRTLPGSMPGEAPIRWSADGSSLYVYRPGPPPVDVYRIHAATGARELWKQIAPADPAGVETVGPIVMTPDASSWVQGYQRRFSDLYVVEGLK